MCSQVSLLSVTLQTHSVLDHHLTNAPLPQSFQTLESVSKLKIVRDTFKHIFESRRCAIPNQHRSIPGLGSILMQRTVTLPPLTTVNPDEIGSASLTLPVPHRQGISISHGADS